MTMTVPFIHSLSALPESFRFTPVDGFKRPIHGLAWEANPYTLEKLTDNWHRFEGIGLMTGPISGAMSLDMDGIGSDLSFEAITGHPVSDLPPTVGWSSGRPGRLGRVFTVPSHWWERITGGKSRSIDGAGKFELRGPGQQAVMVGKHPNDKLTIGAGEPDQKVAPGQGDGTGFYEWLPGQSPDQIQVAAAPEWLLEAWAGMCAPRRKTTEATGFKPKKSHEELLFDLERVNYLQELFQPFGRISRVYLAKDKETMVSRGFAFVSFVHREDAARAMDKLQGYGYDHLILKLEWARPSAPKDPASEGTQFRSGYGKALAQDTKEKVSYASNLTTGH